MTTQSILARLEEKIRRFATTPDYHYYSGDSITEAFAAARKEIEDAVSTGFYEAHLRVCQCETKPCVDNGAVNALRIVKEKLIGGGGEG